MKYRHKTSGVTLEPRCETVAEMLRNSDEYEQVADLPPKPEKPKSEKPLPEKAEPT